MTIIMGGVFTTKDIELKLVSELMKNCRRSDRELSKILGVSQPTVSRMIKKLEKEGHVRQYAMIPDFSKIGFEIMAFTLAKMREQMTEQQLVEARRAVHELSKKTKIPSILGMTGMGCNADRVLVSLHEDYASFSTFIRGVKRHPLIKVEDLRTFVVNLHDESHFLPLDLSYLADYIQANIDTLKQKSK